MTAKTKSLMLAFGLLAASTGLAAAADWNNGAGGINVYRGGAAVPVPAPAPMPVQAADWYMRADLAFAATSGGNVGQSGPYLDLKAPDDMPRYFGGGIAVGRYITPSIRADFSIDYRSKQRLASGTTVNNRIETTTVGGLKTIEHWSDSYNNEASNGNYAFMLNGYYDFRNDSRFTPYVGAGVGVSMRTLSRVADDQHTCVSTDTIQADGSVTSAAGGCTTPTPASYSSSQNATAYGLAAALMAGVSYEISPGVLWDSGYRFMYFNGNVAATAPTGLGGSVIKIGDRTDHEFRTGLRWNID